MKRFAVGLECSWWDLASRVCMVPAILSPFLPSVLREHLPSWMFRETYCCPLCSQPVELVSWRFAALMRNSLRASGDESFIAWSRGKCFPNSNVARAEFRLATGEKPMKQPLQMPRTNRDLPATTPAAEKACEHCGATVLSSQIHVCNPPQALRNVRQER